MSEDSSWHEEPTQGQPVEPQSRKVIVVLENASLEAARLNPYRDSKMQLLNCDEHQSILKRLGRDIADARPDIVHQVILFSNDFFEKDTNFFLFLSLIVSFDFIG
jgi:rRNA small subunit pseudouridine methyltransferase Nep1